MSKQVIVIGGGIVGASTAYYLAKQGAAVTLIDRNDQGQATDAAAGIICPWISQRRNKDWYHLAKSGAALYTKLIAELKSLGETNTGYEKVGAISLHTETKKLEGMVERATKRKETAPEIGEISTLNELETLNRVPILKEGYRSVYISGAARVNGQELLQALKRAGQLKGVKIIEGDASLSIEDNQIKGVHVDNQYTLPADKVILANGAWMSELVKPFGIDLQVFPQRAQITHVKLPGVDTTKWPVIMPPGNQYMLSLPDNRIVLGSTYEDNVGFDYRITAGKVHQILDKAFNIAPELENSTVVETKVGFRPFTPGSLPIVGPLHQIKGVYLANGLGGTGLTMGPFVGQQLAKIALGELPDIELENYDVSKAIASQ